MRLVCRLLACALFPAFALSARASKINVYDPPGFTTNPITTSPFVIGGPTPFAACSAGELPDPTLVEAGCFAGVNRTGTGWTALELVVPNFGTSFTCNTDDPANQIFSASSCTFDAASNSYDLVFSGGTLGNGSLFFITEDDIDPSLFPNVTVNATFASTSATPEPSSLLLLATGFLGAGRCVSRRHKDAS